MVKCKSTEQIREHYVIAKDYMLEAANGFRFEARG